GKPIDARVDVYAVGSILYEMLSGRAPFVDANALEILAKKATESPPPLRTLNSQIPEGLASVIESCLERDPDRRPQTMGALEYELIKSMKGRGSAVAAVLGIKSGDDDAPSPFGFGDPGSQEEVDRTNPASPPAMSKSSIPTIETQKQRAVPSFESITREQH